ncbi:hypothetical protein GCM10010517_51680 [Streptosporangium fragile]|uniref:DoxX family protein n=1 Tax=Streptosporangium fragile TaxID=46186 RepID=A0ABN3W381_9ACTN
MQEVVPPTHAVRGRPVPAGLLYGLRILVVAHAAGLVVAAAFAGRAVLPHAGQVVQGGGGPAETHVMAGMVVHLIALLQIVAAVLVWRPGRGAGWPALVSVGLFLIGLGRHISREVPGTHGPGGLALLGLTVAVLVVWAWSPGAAVRRS